ncbi:MAG: CoA-binding protein [Akkermansiaceae bacterium]|nr:CoA-binding protein [Armatimonadota bacterium]
MNETITAILSAKTFAVVGASANTEKFGYKVWHMLRQHGKTAYAVNPNVTEIAGEVVYPSLADLPETPEAVIAVVPPEVTETLPAQLAVAGIRYLWLQPGAESETAVANAQAHDIGVVHRGPCILVQARAIWNMPHGT